MTLPMASTRPNPTTSTSTHEPDDQTPEHPDPAALQLTVAAEISHITNQIRALQTLHPHEVYGIYTHPSNGGVRIMAPSHFGAKLNHSVAFGFQGEVTSATVEEVESAGGEEAGKQPLRFDVCDFAHPSAMRVLREMGYGSIGFIDTFASWTDGWEGKGSGEGDVGAGGGVIVERYAPGQGIDEFVTASVDGFISGGRPRELLTALAQSAAAREDTVRFRATVGGRLAGTAGMAVFAVGVKVANLYIDSTFPEFRGKGVHRALLLARITAAREAGCSLVIASARADSGSARNIERAGLKKLFGSETFMKGSGMQQ